MNYAAALNLLLEDKIVPQNIEFQYSQGKRQGPQSTEWRQLPVKL